MKDKQSYLSIHRNLFVYNTWNVVIWWFVIYSYFPMQKITFLILIGFSTLVVQLWYNLKQTIAKQNKVSLSR